MSSSRRNSQQQFGNKRKISTTGKSPALCNLTYSYDELINYLQRQNAQKISRVVYQFLLQRFAADDFDRDGQISLSEFIILVQHLDPENELHADSGGYDNLRLIFKKYDQNGNNHIEFHEFVLMVLTEHVFEKIKSSMNFFC